MATATVIDRMTLLSPPVWAIQWNEVDLSYG